MAELADALDSGSSEGSFMQVQVLFPAPESNAKFDTMKPSLKNEGFVVFRCRIRGNKLVDGLKVHFSG